MIVDHDQNPQVKNKRATESAIAAKSFPGHQGKSFI